MRIDRESVQHLAKLIPNPLRSQVQGIRRRTQTLVARKDNSPLGARGAQKLGAAHVRIEAYVNTAQPEPSRQAREHPVGRKARNLGIRFQSE